MLLLFAVSVCPVNAQEFVKYNVEVRTDGSAAWIITQATDTQSPTDTWLSFQEKILTLVETASTQTQREMSVDLNSLEMKTTNFADTQSKITEYQFTWKNFSIIEDTQIIFGDVFGVSNFFGSLYGDGSLEIIYPQTFEVQSVSPMPNGGNDAQVLEWLGTNFFVNANPSITLVENTDLATGTSQADSGLWLLIILVVAVVCVAIAFLYLRRRGKKPAAKTQEMVRLPVVESEEDKIVKALLDSGGSSSQSAITRQCMFSKAKTSQLLTALEKDGVVTRYKKGRDKIVVLTEKGKGNRHDA
ncbi:MAG: winged helix DNA-binding protein [Candidatus Bathyarchaeota archaeon]|nr:winged helix DNA-binding protein [Candidatus Bathyarchaeota archaeon]